MSGKIENDKILFSLFLGCFSTVRFPKRSVDISAAARDERVFKTGFTDTGFVLGK